MARLGLPAAAGDEPVYLCSDETNGFATSLYLDTEHNTLYFPRYGSVHPLTLLACPLSQPPGGPVIKLDLESATDLQGFTGDDTYFYWSDGLGVWRVPKAAVAPVSAATPM